MARPPSSTRVLAVARGDEPADLLLRNGRVFVPHTREWIDTDLAVADGRIAGWGPREAREEVDVGGAALTPGFIDAHMHLESTKLWVDEFVRSVLPHGTTAVAADPHEVANVFGVRGVAALADAARTLPFTFGVCASSCVPASPFESPGAVVGVPELEELIDDVGSIGVAEVMNFPAVIAGDSEFRAKIAAAAWRRVDGHAPGLGGHALDAYLAAGVESDHESTVLAEAIEKRRKGMWVFIREGSASQNLRDLIAAVLEHGTDRVALCTDDREPDTIREIGHMNDCVRLAVDCGVSPEDALVMATVNVAEYHNFHHLGSLGPGYQADVLCFDRLDGWEPARVWQAGRLVAEAGQIVPGAVPDAPAPDWMRASVHLSHAVDADELTIAPPASGMAKVIGITAGSLSTTALVVDVADMSTDLARIGVLERHHNTGRIGLGYVSGFGLRRGAIGSTVAHDAHNVMLVGARDASGPGDMAVAAARLREIGGGQVVVLGGQVLGEVRLPIGGLMSDRRADYVADELTALVGLARRHLDVEIAAPFMQLSFLGLSVIPELRLTDKGLVDVVKFELTGIDAG
jgi:adenine deaminase